MDRKELIERLKADRDKAGKEGRGKSIFKKRIRIRVR